MSMFFFVLDFALAFVCPFGPPACSGELLLLLDVELAVPLLDVELLLSLLLPVPARWPRLVLLSPLFFATILGEGLGPQLRTW